MAASLATSGASSGAGGCARDGRGPTERAGASLRARVLDASGAPLAEASVHLAGNTYPSDESDYDENVFRSVRVGDWRASADASGVCAFDALPPEVIRRQQRDRRPRRPAAARGDRAREVRRQRGNLFYQVRYDGLVVAGAGVPAGASAETAVPAGHVVVECQWRSTSETKEIDLDVGKDAELVFGSDGG